jgi:hypothetical protein
MKRKAGLAAMAALLLLCAFFALKLFAGARPFKDLQEGDIESAAVECIPPGVKKDLSRDEIKELADLLRTVVVYHWGAPSESVAGQAVLFTIIKTDGALETVNACNPFLFLNGAGYKTKYGPCEELSAFGNRIIGR